MEPRTTWIKRRRRLRIRRGIRNKIKGTAERPRLCVFRSNRDIYAQLIDDDSGHTLVSASSRENELSVKAAKTEGSKRVGKALAERAVASGVSHIVFDRGGYLYHGRVKALADAAREAGLKF